MFGNAPSNNRQSWAGQAARTGAPVNPGPSSGPTVTSARPPVVPGRGLLGPRRPRHSIDLDGPGGGTAGATALPVGDDGVLIGTDAAQQPALLGLFRADPLEVALVGGLWTAQVIALRAAALGARVAVETGRPQAWAALAQAAGAEQPCVTVHGVGQLGPQGAGVAGPVLIVRDCGARPGRSRLAATPWQSTLTLLPYLAPRAERLIGSADVVAVQRISPQEAEQVGRTLAMPATDVQALSTLGDSVSLWATRRHRRYVMTVPTGVESQLLGPARRVD